MTHTLHPEFETNLNNLARTLSTEFIPEKKAKETILAYLAPYLLPPSQHLKDEPLPEYTTTINTKELEALKIKARKYDELCK